MHPYNLTLVSELTDTYKQLSRNNPGSPPADGLEVVDVDNRGPQDLEAEWQSAHHQESYLLVTQVFLEDHRNRGEEESKRQPLRAKHNQKEMVLPRRSRG